jgi:hypothetical protein
MQLKYTACVCQRHRLINLFLTVMDESLLSVLFKNLFWNWILRAAVSALSL